MTPGELCSPKSQWCSEWQLSWVSGDPQKEMEINYSVVARYGPHNSSYGKDAFHADAAQMSPVRLC